jgi:hypothetical protein
MVVFNDVSAPCAVSNANARSWHVVDQIVRRTDSFGARDVDTGDLLAENPAIVNEVVFGAAFKWKFAQGAIGQRKIADEANGAIACFSKLTT